MVQARDCASDGGGDRAARGSSGRDQRKPCVPVRLEEQRVRREPQGGPRVPGKREPIGVMGAGWVGLVTAACFAELGHDVYVRDIDPERIRRLRANVVPIHEEGLTELLTTYRDRLHFTLDAGEVFRAARLVFVCVGTPPTYSGDADLTAVWRLVREIPKVGAPTTLVMKSTVPVGTGAKVRAELDSCGLTNV